MLLPGAKTTDITGPLLYQIEGKGRGLGYCFGMFILPQKAGTALIFRKGSETEKGAGGL